MYKIAILGCENSHANKFLEAVIKRKIVTDIEFVGVYSEDVTAAEALREKYGVHVAKSYDDFTGKVDGIMITARHGDNHYKYAKPYIESGIPMFIDKPITCSEEDAKDFLEDLKAHNIPISGGSVCAITEHIQNLKSVAATKEYGEVLGGFLRAPVQMNSPHGGFLFYAPHLVSAMTEVFGCYPNSVQAVKNGTVYSCIVRYDAYDVNLSFVDGNYLYYAGISCEKAYIGDTYIVNSYFDREIKEFYKLLTGGKQQKSYEDFFASVYILNALDKAIKSGFEIKVNRYKEVII